jgi:hypothetical protein
MAKVVKPAGKTAADSKKDQKIHGSGAQGSLARSPLRIWPGTSKPDNPSNGNRRP